MDAGCKLHISTLPRVNSQAKIFCLRSAASDNNQADLMDPKEFREVGHRVVDMLAEYLEHIEEKPVFPDVEPRKLTELFDESLPRDSSPPEKVLQGQIGRAHV